MQRSALYLRSLVHVDISMVLQQFLDHVSVATVSCIVQRSPPVISGAIKVCDEVLEGGFVKQFFYLD